MLKEITNKTRLSEYLEMPTELLEKTVPDTKGGKDPKRGAGTPPGSPTKGIKENLRQQR